MDVNNWCFWTVVLEKTRESPLDCKEIKPVNPKGNHSWIFIGRTDAEAETLVLWPPDRKNWLIGKDPDAGKDWRREEKGTTENEMVGWHHQPDGHEFEQALGVGDGQGGLECCKDHGGAKSRTRLSNWTNRHDLVIIFLHVHLLSQFGGIINIDGKIPWRKKCHPTPVFLPGKSHWPRSLLGYGLCGHKALDTTEHLNTQH